MPNAMDEVGLGRGNGLHSTRMLRMLRIFWREYGNQLGMPKSLKLNVRRYFSTQGDSSMTIKDAGCDTLSNVPGDLKSSMPVLLL